MSLKLCLFFVHLLIPIVSSTFFINTGSCYCPPPPVCAPEPVCARSIPVQAVAPAPVVVPVQVPTAYYAEGCYGADYYPSYGCSPCKRKLQKELIKRKLVKHRRRFKRSTITINSNGSFGVTKKEKRRKNAKMDMKCNSERLRKIMKKAMGAKTSTLKRNIQLLVENKLGSQFNVICGKGKFTYSTTTEEYCQTQVMDRTCYVFRRNLSLNDEEEKDYDDIIEN